MIRKLLLAFGFLVPAVLIAQPTVTRDWLGQSGDAILVENIEQPPAVGEAGANVNWDFSNIMRSDTPFVVQFQYVTSDTTQFADEFPTSNLAWYSPGLGFYNYFNLTNEVWEDLGGGFQSVLQIYDDPIKRLEFPFAFGASFTDTFEGTSTFMGITSYITGSTQVMADAYGTLELPEATIEDAVRIKTIEERADSTDLGLGIAEKVYSITTTYTWLSANHPGPVANHSVDSGYTIAFFPPLAPDTVFTDASTSFSFDPTAGSFSSVKFLEETFTLEVSPNPFTEYMNLTFFTDRPEELTFVLQDVLGHVVYREKIQSVSGQNSVQVRPGNLVSGSYVALLYSGSGGTSRTLLKWEN